MEVKLGKLKLSSHKKIQIKHLIASVVVLMIVISQIERFVTQGTLLGYQVRSVQSEASKLQQNRSGSLINGKVSKENQKSIACDTFPASEVQKKLKQDVERISGFVADRSDPYLISSCIYRTKAGDNKRTIALLVREQKDKQVAQKTLQTLKAGSKGDVVKGVGDEAFFNTSANQLTVRVDKKIFTVTVPRVNESEDNKSLAVDIVKIAL